MDWNGSDSGGKAVSWILSGNGDQDLSNFYEFCCKTGDWLNYGT